MADDFISGLYQNSFGRAPDAAGMSYWQGQAANGMNPGQMADAFGRSQEYGRSHPGSAAGMQQTQPLTNPYATGQTGSNYPTPPQPYTNPSQGAARPFTDGWTTNTPGSFAGFLGQPAQQTQMGTGGPLMSQPRQMPPQPNMNWQQIMPMLMQMFQGRGGLGGLGGMQQQKQAPAPGTSMGIYEAQQRGDPNSVFY